MDDKTHPTHTSWALWYHNPHDQSWDLKSYTKVCEFQSIEQFWLLYKNWDTYLPKVFDGMYFLMRKLKNGNYIYPMWEDKYNKRGGFWSFKIAKEEAVDVWNKLSMHLIGEQIANEEENIMTINGISISPKKSFCIIKIWNSDFSLKSNGLIDQGLDFLDFKEVMYKCHNDNIVYDQQKAKKPRPKPHGEAGAGGNYRFSGRARR
jgi:translation initiation factor 4E